MNWRNFDKPQLDTFDPKVKDGGLLEGLGNVAAGDTLPVAILKSITGGRMNHENVSATQGGVVGIGALVNVLWPGHGEAVAGVVAALFALLGAIKPFLQPKQ